MSARSPYELLQVSTTAHPAVIEAAYRALMKRHHPDHAGDAGDPEQAAAINQAYAVLKSPESRAEHDRRVDAERRDRAARAQARLTALGGTAPAARANLFGWSGWLVALAVCGILVTMPRPAPVATSVAAPTAAVSSPIVEAAPEPDPWDSAGPVPEPLPQDDADPAPVEAETSAPAVLPVPVPLVTTPAAPAPRAAVRNARPRATTNQVRQRRATAARRSATQRARSSARREQSAAPRDFLEREGYIY